MFWVEPYLSRFLTRVTAVGVNNTRLPDQRFGLAACYHLPLPLKFPQLCTKCIYSTVEGGLAGCNAPPSRKHHCKQSCRARGQAQASSTKAAGGAAAAQLVGRGIMGAGPTAGRCRAGVDGVACGSAGLAMLPSRAPEQHSAAGPSTCCAASVVLRVPRQHSGQHSGQHSALRPQRTNNTAR